MFEINAFPSAMYLSYFAVAISLILSVVGISYGIVGLKTCKKYYERNRNCYPGGPIDRLLNANRCLTIAQVSIAILVVTLWVITIVETRHIVQTHGDMLNGTTQIIIVSICAAFIATGIAMSAGATAFLNHTNRIMAVPMQGENPYDIEIARAENHSHYPTAPSIPTAPPLPTESTSLAQGIVVTVLPD